MGFLVRFLPFLAILAVGVGTMLLGLDLMTLPQNSGSRSISAPNKSVTAPNKLAQHVADQRAEKTEGDAGRPLTPLYPANPSGAKDVRTVYPPSNQSAAKETTGAAPAQTSADAAPKAGDSAATPQASQPQPPQATPQPAPQPRQAATIAPPQRAAAKDQPRTETVKADAPKTPAPAAQAGTVQPVSNHCDVQACAGAYSSFRASDCTYQPYQGPRRACVAPPASQQRSAERTRTREITPRLEQAARIDDRDDERSYDRGDELRVMPPRPPAAIPGRAYDDDDDDYDAPRPSRRVIMIDRGYRPY